MAASGKGWQKKPKRGLRGLIPVQRRQISMLESREVSGIYQGASLVPEMLERYKSRSATKKDRFA